MTIKDRIKSLSAALVSAAAVLTGLVSCDNAIYDFEGDCERHYLVRFKFDYNMNSADAFASEVNAVTLHLIDGDGKVVWQKSESGTELAREGYMMEVDINPGTYSLLAWCSSAEPSTFELNNEGHRESLRARFNRDIHDDGNHHISTELDRLYHGHVADVEFPADEGGTYVFLVPLKKDTNHLTVALQQLSGEPIDKDLVKFEITDDNAHLNWDNEPIHGEPVTYHEWHKETVKADLSARSADNQTFGGVIADLTVSRLMKAHSPNAKLKVYRTDNGETIASIRLIDALLLVKGEYNRRWDDQEFLDRKDDYNLIFFLDENHKWLSGMIQIESWRVVYSEEKLD